MKTCNTEELYLLHRQRLLSLIQSKVEDVQKAEDLLHDSFVKLEKCCGGGCTCEKPKAYLFRTALNIVFDYIKKRRKRSNEVIDIPQSLNHITDQGEHSSCDLFSCINGYLDDTSQENRIAFEQVDLLQNPQVQVAEELGIPLATLKSRVQRTRKYLRKRLQTCCPDYRTKCL